MPELPEVETIRRQLEKMIVGKTIAQVEIRRPKIFRGRPKDVIGAKITSINRRGKLLIIELNNNQTLLVHLKLTGQLIFRAPDIPDSPDLPNKYSHVIFTLAGENKALCRPVCRPARRRGRLFYNDLRQFGWIKIVKNSGVQSDLKNLGLEPFDKEFTLDYFQTLLSRSGRPVKVFLLDQTKIAGIGNIYANESLFCARIHPAKPASDLSKHSDKIKALYDCLQKVLKLGLKYQGASDQYYLTAKGEKGQMQKHFKVYGRAGERCLNNCGSKIERITLAGRGTFYCPRCQS